MSSYFPLEVGELVMKRVVLFLIFFVSITSKIFAFKNDYFEVNNEGMKASDIGNGANFVLYVFNNPDYKCPISRCPNPPFISVDVKPLNGPRPSYDSMETAENLAKDHVKRLKEFDKRIRSFGTADYVLDRISVGQFGDKRAFYYEITKATNIKRVYTITTEKNIYTITINSCKDDNFKDIQAYRRFVDSFKISDLSSDFSTGSNYSARSNSSNRISNNSLKPKGQPGLDGVRYSKTGKIIKEKKHDLTWTLFSILVFLLALIAAKIKKSL